MTEVIIAVVFYTIGFLVGLYIGNHQKRVEMRRAMLNNMAAPAAWHEQGCPKPNHEMTGARDPQR